MTKNMALIILISAVIVFSPIATIVSINTLFGTMIPVNIYTWLSALWLGVVIGGAKASSK